VRERERGERVWESDGKRNTIKGKREREREGESNVARERIREWEIERTRERINTTIEREKNIFLLGYALPSNVSVYVCVSVCVCVRLEPYSAALLPMLLKEGEEED
jgi:hypothetical protein